MITHEADIAEYAKRVIQLVDGRIDSDRRTAPLDALPPKLAVERHGDDGVRMSVAEAFRMAVQGVLSNRLRSLLTMLGITIGVAAVIILVAVGHGSAVAVSQPDRGARHERRHDPARRLRLRRGSGGFRSSFTQLTMKDVKALAGSDGCARHQVGGAGRQRLGDRDLRRRELLAEPVPRHDALLRGGAEVARRGRHVHHTADESTHARVVVLGETVVLNLFGSADPLGQTIKLNGTVHRGGVLVPRARTASRTRTTSSSRRSRRAGPDHRRTSGLSQIVIRRSRRTRWTRPRPRRRRSSRRPTPRTAPRTSGS